MHRISLWILLLICLTLAGAAPLRAAAPVAGKSSKELRDEGRKALNGGNFYQAETLLTAAVKAAEAEASPDQDTIYLLAELAGVNNDCDHPALAEASYRRALQIREAAIGPNRIENFELLLPLGFTCKRLKKYDEALALFERCQKLVESKLGKYHPWVANCIGGQALILDAQGHPEKAEPLYRKAVDLAGSQHSNIDYRKAGDPGRGTGGRFYKTVYLPNYRLTAGLLENLGRFYLRQNRPADAEKIYERQVKVVEQEFSKDPDALADALNDLGVACLALKKYPEAEKDFQRVLAMQNQQPGVHSFTLAEACHHLAVMRVAQQQIAEADAYLERLLTVRPQEGRPNLRDIANLSRLAVHYSREGDPAEAEALLKFAVSVKEAVWGKDDPRLAPFAAELGQYYYARQQYDLAEPALKNALTTGLKSPAPEAGKLLPILNVLFDVSSRKKDNEANRAYALQAVKLIEKDAHHDLQEFIPMIESLTEFCRKRKLADDVFKLTRQLLDTLENSKNPDKNKVANACQSLAETHLARTEPALAEPLLVKALALQEKSRDADSMVVMTLLIKLAAAYTAQGKDAEVAGVLERQITITEGLFGKSNPVLVTTLTEYAGALKRLKRDADAEAVAARIQEIRAAK